MGLIDFSFSLVCGTPWGWVSAISLSKPHLGVLRDVELLDLPFPQICLPVLSVLPEPIFQSSFSNQTFSKYFGCSSEIDLFASDVLCQSVVVK